MALNPTIELILRQLSSLDESQLHEASLELVRGNFDRLVKFGSGSLGALDDMRDVTLELSGRFLHARLFTPKRAKNGGLAVYFHGGGWVLGSVDGFSPMTAELARKISMPILSVDYRLAPEHKFPAAALDAIEALQVIAFRKSEFASPDAKLFILGDSAGGNLCAVAANHLNSLPEPIITAQALMYPVVDFTETASVDQFGEGYFLTLEQISYFQESYLNSLEDLENVLLNPSIDTRLKYSPPTLLITPEFDPLRDGAESYGWRLVQAGVLVAFHRYEGMIHGFVSMGVLTQVAFHAMAEVGDFFSQFL